MADNIQSFDATRSVPMQVLSRRIYRGPHLYSQTPMIQIQLDLGDLEAWPTDRLTEALVAVLPGLHGHGCSYGEPGGFIRRMREGTWLGHVIEHVALELQSLVGTTVSRGKTRSVKGRPGVYNVMFSYIDEFVGLAAGRLAVELVDSLLPVSLQRVRGGWMRLQILRCFRTLMPALPDYKAWHRDGRTGRPLPP